MKWLIYKYIFLASIALLLFSCSGEVIRMDQDGKVVTFSVGKKFEVHLESPVNDGYYWEAAGINSHVIYQDGPPIIKTAEQTNKTHHTYIFRFETINEGNALLKFYLYAPDSNGREPLEDFEIMINSGKMG